MDTLKIHSESREDSLSFLKQKYDRFKQSLKHNSKLTEEQKQQELKNLNAQLKTERKNSTKNLY